MIIDKVENESKLNDGLSLVYFFSRLVFCFVFVYPLCCTFIPTTIMITPAYLNI